MVFESGERPMFPRASAYYLVRTVLLVEGQKNVLEIYVDGKRTARSAYTY